MLDCYARLVTRRPWLILVVVSAVVAICAPVGLILHSIPDFSEPLKGLETRGTPIAGHRQAYMHMYEAVNDGKLQYPVASKFLTPFQKYLASLQGVRQHTCLSAPVNGSSPRMVLQSKKGNMFTAKHMKAICQFEDQYIKPHMQHECPAQTLPFYIGSLRQKNCSQLTDSDMQAVMRLLRECSGYFLNGSLSEKCAIPGSCPHLPGQCVQGGAVYKIFYYFMDMGFLEGDDPFCNKLSYTMLFFPQSWTYTQNQLKSYFLEHLDGKHLANDLVFVEGMELNLSFDVFPGFIGHDMLFYILAMTLVILLLLIYLRSWLMMVAVLFNVGCSIAVSYLVYFEVFRVGFFPFMNLIAGLLIIGITADDVFILYDIWHKVRQHEPDLPMCDVMSVTLRHGALSIFVTSFTTATALFANLVSDITCVRCFSVFAGICVLVNCVFMLTAVPALIAIAENAPDFCAVYLSRHNFCQWFDRKSRQLAHNVWHKYVPLLVTRFWPVWIGVFSLIGIAGVVVVFITPTLKLPSSAHIRFFKDSQTFEIYNLELRQHFYFEVDSRGRRLDVQWLWGLDGVDRGSSMDPDDEGSLNFDDSFDLFAQETQQFHLNFCRDLQQQHFVLNSEQYPCFMDRFRSLITSPCDVTQVSQSPILCCNRHFPVNASVAKVCLTSDTFLNQLYSSELMGNFLQTPDGEIKILQYYVPTTYTWSASHPVMDSVHSELREFTDTQLRDAPRGSCNGWFSSARLQYQFLYYDLQNELESSSYVGLILALSIGFAVLLLTSMNLLLTLYAILTIVLVIATTMACLVLQGWKLNVSESLTITLTVGLSIDFTIHCGIAYKVSPRLSREGRVSEALSTVGSAVFMAGLTTFAAGAALVPFANVIAFQRFGIFLMIVMFVSVSFAIFFFLSLCTVIGPMGVTGDLVALVKRLKSLHKKKSSPGSPTNLSHCAINGKPGENPSSKEACLEMNAAEDKGESDQDV